MIDKYYCECCGKEMVPYPQLDRYGRTTGEVVKYFYTCKKATLSGHDSYYVDAVTGKVISNV